MLSKDAINYASIGLIIILAFAPTMPFGLNLLLNDKLCQILLLILAVVASSYDFTLGLLLSMLVLIRVIRVKEGFVSRITDTQHELEDLKDQKQEVKAKLIEIRNEHGQDSDQYKEIKARFEKILTRIRKINRQRNNSEEVNNVEEPFEKDLTPWGDDELIEKSDSDDFPPEVKDNEEMEGLGEDEELDALDALEDLTGEKTADQIVNEIAGEDLSSISDQLVETFTCQPHN